MSEPSFRIAYDAADLRRRHPPQFRHPHKRRLYELAYADGPPPTGTVEVTRWPKREREPLTLDSPMPVDLAPGFYDYEPTNHPAPRIEWHVNFADPHLFCAYGSGLFAQDEMQVAEHPQLGCVLEALNAAGLPARTREAASATPVLVRGVERRIAVATNPDPAAGRPFGLYGNRFAAADFDAVRLATRRIDPPTISNIVAMAAPACGSGRYSEADIDAVLITALTAFSAAREESLRAAGPSAAAVVHSGFWGCGAFGGNRDLMIALQILAARAAGIARLVLHAADEAGVEDARRGLSVADSLAAETGELCRFSLLTARAAARGFRWGVSDGN